MTYEKIKLHHEKIVRQVKFANLNKNGSLEDYKAEVEKGFSANILENKSIGNCSNNGISHWCDSVLIVSDIKECQIFDITPKTVLRSPLVVIKKRGDYVYAEPLDAPDSNNVGWMMGGSFIYSSDSRFRDYFNGYPIPLHDRQETQEEYEMMSR